MVRDRQADYYRVPGQADGNATATSFVEFMLEATRAALEEAVASDQVNDQVGDQVIRLLGVVGKKEFGASELMSGLGHSHRLTFREDYLEPALAAAVIGRTQPDSPRSPTQRYRLTDKGRRLLKTIQNDG